MQSTLVDVNAVAGGGKGTNPKTTLYVGGLEENVNEAILHSAFIPFGDITDVNIPLDHATGECRLDTRRCRAAVLCVISVYNAQSPACRQTQRFWLH